VRNIYSKLSWAHSSAVTKGFSNQGNLLIFKFHHTSVFLLNLQGGGGCLFPLSHQAAAICNIHHVRHEKRMLSLTESTLSMTYVLPAALSQAAIYILSKHAAPFS